MIQHISWDENGLLTVVSKNGKIIFTNEDTCMVDKYGNTFTIDALKATFQQHSPTYEELYEYWTKTKDKENKQ